MRVKSSRSVEQDHTNRFGRAHTGAPGRLRNLGLALLVLAACLWGAARWQPARAQDATTQPGETLFAGNVDSSLFPTVAVDIYAVAGDGLPLTQLTAADLIFAEDGSELATAQLQMSPSTNTPLNIVVAINRATAPADWATSIEAVRGLLNQLGVDDRVGVVAYNESAETLIAPTQDLDAVRAALANAQPGGTQSAFYVAVNQALRLFEDVDGRRALVVVTDRGNTTAEGGPTVAPALGAAARQLGAAAHIFGFGAAGANPDFLQLAQATGGRAVVVSVATDVAPNLAALPALLRQGFRVRYASALAATGDNHLLAMALRSANSAARLTRSFAASRRPVDVQITQPSDGQRVSGSTVITFDAAAPAPLARVTFLLDTGEIITSTQSALGGIIWNSTGAPYGSRRLTVRVEDSAGNVGEDEIGIEVVAPLTLGVQLGAPEATVGETVVVTALVNSALGGATVEAFVGRTQVGVQANQQGAIPFLIDTSGFTPGRYGIFVRAADAQGNLVTDNSQVLAVAPVANTNITPARVWSTIVAWFGRNWLWIVGAVLSILLLVLLWLVVRSISASIQRARRERQAAQARVAPQVRMFITNQGNVRTPYRLRAESPSSDVAFTFLAYGVPLHAPIAARVAAPGAPAVYAGAVAANGTSGTLLAGNGRYAQPAVTATQAQAAVAGAHTAAHASAQTAASTYAGAAQAADTGSRLLNSLGRLIPGAAGDQFRSAGNTLVAQQTAVRRAQGQYQDVAGDVEDVGYYGKQMAPASAIAGTGQGTATSTTGAVSSAPAPQPAPQPAPRRANPVDPAFALQGPLAVESGAIAARAGMRTAWVETPQIAPGDTLGIDIYVAPLAKTKRNAAITFNVTSAPVAGAGPGAGTGADVTTNAVTVRLTRKR